MERNQKVEDYMRIIYRLRENGLVRGAYIARELGVTKPTVSVALKEMVRLRASQRLLQPPSIHTGAPTTQTCCLWGPGQRSMTQRHAIQQVLIRREGRRAGNSAWGSCGQAVRFLGHLFPSLACGSWSFSRGAGVLGRLPKWPSLSSSCS